VARYDIGPDGALFQTTGTLVATPDYLSSYL
jgi:hypothetical protein